MDEQEKKRELLRRKKERERKERLRARAQEESSFDESMEIITLRGSIRGTKL